MINYSTSKQLIKNTQNFLNIKHYTIVGILLGRKDVFYGWGRKRSGEKAIELAKKHDTSFVLLEDGFIRSLGLGVNGSPSFSLVEDDLGIYYDATAPSKLENILSTYDFTIDVELLEDTRRAIGLIRQHNISKYNNAPNISEDFFMDNDNQRVLVIAQTAGDASLKYGMLDAYTTNDMITAAIKENPDTEVYLKIHPDVLSGKKKSDIDIEDIPEDVTIITENVNPISLLKHYYKVYTKTSGMGFEALLCGCECVCFGMPFYAGWGVTDDRSVCERRTRTLSVEEIFAGAYILYTRYFNPFTQKKSDINDTIKSIVKYRDIYSKNEGDLYFFGFSRWKRRFTLPFFPALKKNNIFFCSTFEDTLKKGLNNQSKVYIWGKKQFPELESYAKEQKVPLLRVEDGFVRSVSLGSDLTKAYSLVVDSRGIYFDPTQESDLEQILNTYEFDETLIQRAKDLQVYLIENKISKYNIYKDKQLMLDGLKQGQTVVMVPGQVEDDASIIYGADGMSNLELLQQTRKNAPEAYIIYKPHPDVLAGNRKGDIPSDVAMKYCDAIIKEASLDSVLELADEVHTLTSLVGFEGLIRGKEVYTYGLPFYAGWGLTHDAKVCQRRTRKRSLHELIAAAFILYPRYIHPKTNEYCEIEVLLTQIDKEKNRYNNDFLYRTMINSRNFVSRKIQLLVKVILGE